MIIKFFQKFFGYVQKFFGYVLFSIRFNNTTSELRKKISATYGSASSIKRNVNKLSQIMHSRYATEEHQATLLKLWEELTSETTKRLKNKIQSYHTHSSEIDSLIEKLNILINSEFATEEHRVSVLQLSGELEEIHIDEGHRDTGSHSDTYEEEHAMCGSDYCAGGYHIDEDSHSDYGGQNWRPAKLDF